MVITLLTFGMKSSTQLFLSFVAYSNNTVNNSDFLERASFCSKEIERKLRINIQPGLRRLFYFI